MSVETIEKNPLTGEYLMEHGPQSFVSCDDCGDSVAVQDVLESLDSDLTVNEYQVNCTRFFLITQIARGWYAVNDSPAWQEFPYSVFLCESCAAHCSDCGELGSSCNMQRIANGDVLCEVCCDEYFTCDNCGDMHHNDESHSIDDGNYLYCGHCYENFTYWCEPCDMTHPEDAQCSEYDDYHNGYDVDSGSRLIHNYSHKPAPVFHQLDKTDDSKLFFGLELEVEAVHADRSAGAELVKNSLGDFVYLKSDGSIEYGFEIVTHPFNFDYYKTINFGFVDELRGLGFRSWDSKTCGLHIHVSRAGFASSGHVWRFANLIINNPKQWQRIAGRNSEQWGTYSKERNNIGKNLTGKGYPERYCAVNMCNADTIEIRIFRGSLNTRRICAAIESVHAAAEYSRALSVQDVAGGALSFERFAAWVNSVSEYANLVELMKAKNLLETGL